MADALPGHVHMPTADQVAACLRRHGYDVTVWTLARSEFGPMVEPGSVPDSVWLTALADAGMNPLPCLDCYQSGDGVDCISGRCRHPFRTGRLILPR